MFNKKLSSFNKKILFENHGIFNTSKFEKSFRISLKFRSSISFNNKNLQTKFSFLFTSLSADSSLVLVIRQFQNKKFLRIFLRLWPFRAKYFVFLLYQAWVHLIELSVKLSDQKLDCSLGYKYIWFILAVSYAY